MDLDLVPILADAIRGYYEDNELSELCDLYGIQLSYDDLRPAYMRLARELISGMGNPATRRFLRSIIESLLHRARDGAGKTKWDSQEYHRSMVDGLTRVQTQFERIASQLDESGMQEQILATPDEKTSFLPNTGNSQEVRTTMPNQRQVFVVHGRDDRLRREFFTFLRALDLQPLEWSEALRLTGKASPYIGEVLDKAFDNAQAVIVLLSPDDEVRLVQELWLPNEDETEKEMHFQARPNVLFEAGMAFGRNPNRTLLVEAGRVKAFSDVAGRHVIRLTNSPESRQNVAERLRTAGCAVSTSGRDWLQQGDFYVGRGDTQAGQERRQEEPTVKWVDSKYPQDVGLQAELESQGYHVRWCPEAALARLLDIEGWSLVTQTTESGQDVVLKIKGSPHNQTLIMKREAGA